MSHGSTPHYSHIVHDINSGGGLTLYFGRRGDQGEGWLPHLDTVMPKNGILFHELHTIDSAVDERHICSPPVHDALYELAAERNTTLLPGGFYGETTTTTQVPTFKPQDLLSLMPSRAAELNNAVVKRYQDLQQIREMRAAVGSLAWLAAYKNIHPQADTNQLVVLWGRTHSTSLPDMYHRLGVNEITTKELNTPLRYTYLHPHGLRWRDSEIKAAFAAAYQHAVTSLKLAH